MVDQPIAVWRGCLYAACGSYMTIALGRPLINLNFDRLDKEASFRSSLIHLRENAEAVMLTGGEDGKKPGCCIGLTMCSLHSQDYIRQPQPGLFHRRLQLDDPACSRPDYCPGFHKRRDRVRRNHPSRCCLAMLVGAFSLIVRQFNSISNFAAVVSRLSSLQEAIEKSHVTELAKIEIVKQDGPLTYEGLTLDSPASEPSLLKELSVSIPFGVRVLVDGATHAPGAALFRATAGMPTQGTGASIVLDDVMFLPQRPYLPSGTLREMLVNPEAESEISPMTGSSECSTRLVLNGIQSGRRAGQLNKIGKRFCPSASSSSWHLRTCFWQHQGSSCWIGSR